MNLCRTLDRLLPLAFLLILATAHLDAWSADAESNQDVSGAALNSPTALQAMPVMVSNRRIIILKGPITGLTATERATASMERIEHVLRTTDTLPRITLEDIEGGRATRISLNSTSAFVITPIDIDKDAGETTQIVARAAALRLENAMKEWREQRTMRYLGLATLRALAATLICALCLCLLLLASRRIARRLALAGSAHLEKTAAGRRGWLDQRLVNTSIGRLLNALGWALAILLTTAWLGYVLEQFPYTRPWGEGLQSRLLALLAGAAAKVIAAIPGLLLVVVIACIARVVVRAAAGFFRRVESGRLEVSWLDADMVRPTQRIATFAIVAFALVMAYPYLPGAGTEAFKGLSVLIGLMISLGGASIIGQALSGLILMYIRAFRKGDYARIGDAEGVIIDVGMFTTRMRTGIGEEIILPNRSVMTNTTINYSRAAAGAGYLVDTSVTIGYATPWRQVEAMLLEAVERTPELATQPAPFVRKTALSDYYVEYRVVACMNGGASSTRVAVLDALHGHIQDVFNTYEVQIMSPHYVADPAQPQVIKPEDWYPKPVKPSSQNA